MAVSINDISQGPAVMIEPCSCGDGSSVPWWQLSFRGWPLPWRIPPATTRRRVGSLDAPG